MPAPLCVTFLWHMHQPYYKDPDNGEYLLPWTYLHAVKDYYDMAAIVDETPGARAVFNLVPSLLDQIEEYASGAALDPFLVKGEMAPGDMNEEERLFVIGNFFSANRQRMIEPNRRYRQLLQLASSGTAENHNARLRSFKDQDILDLQVCFFLSWTGEVSRRKYPELRELLKKGKNYTAADKSLLFSIHREILKGIIPLYRRLHGEGKAELAVSPYFHPILPLLCDTSSARSAMPRVNLPEVRFRHPEDAKGQVAAAISSFERVFGFAPAGMWPSEGSVSDEALSIISECGLNWVASDEEILSHTLPDGLGLHRESLYHPYAFSSGGRELALFFRDHALSDLIGFTYSQWSPDRAVGDFLARLHDIRDHAPKAEVAPIILDGENAWEYYADNGYDFLKLLYGSIAEDKELKMATFSDILGRVPTRKSLQHVQPGSWISGNFGIWIGHPEENLAWEMIGQARRAAVNNSPLVAQRLIAPPGTGDDDETVREICRSIYAAEGSDWFWWYGDDHFSPHEDRFDLLFRKNLINVYRLLRLDPPRELFEPINKGNPPGLVREPADLISPVITGMVSGYFEWLAAGLYDLTRQFSAMHAAESRLQSFHYGYDRKSLYFRIDGSESLDNILSPGDSLDLHLIVDREYLLCMAPGSEGGALLKRQGKSWEPTDISCRWKIVRVCEAEVPLEAVKPEPGGKIFAYISLMRDNNEIGRWPKDSTMELKYVGPEIEHEMWLI